MRGLVGCEQGCSNNLQDSGGDCQFTIGVAGAPEGELTDGNYTISLTTVVASEAPSGDSGLSTGEPHAARKNVRRCLEQFTDEKGLAVDCLPLNLSGTYRRA
jgi:hypothetical protein